MNFRQLKMVLDPEFNGLTKAEFIETVSQLDGRIRVGGPKGKGRLTAKRALALLHNG